MSATEEESATAGEASARPAPWAVTNLVVVVTLVLVIAAFVRLFRVAHNDTATALAILSAVDGPEVVLGVLLTELQSVSAAGLILSFVLYLDVEYPRPGRHEREVNVLAGLLLFFWVTVVAIGHYLLAALTLFVGVPFAIGRLRSVFRQKPGLDPSRWTLAVDRTLRHAPPPPADASRAVRDWYAGRLEQAQRRREQLRRESLLLSGMSAAARAALADRDATRARELLPNGRELTEGELLDLMERVPPTRGTVVANRKARAAGVLIVLLFVLAQVQSDRPWLPRENLRLTGVARSGYVLDNTGAETVVLWESPREVRRVPSAALLTRIVCSDLSLSASPTLWYQFFRPPPTEATYPRCIPASGGAGDAE